MVPEDVCRQVAMMSAERGESICTVVLRALPGQKNYLLDLDFRYSTGSFPR
jgi:hypothetical protein